LRLPRFEHEKPSSIEETLPLIEKADGKAKILAGGTDLLVNMKYGVTRPETVIGIRSIPELSNVTEAGNGDITIGACTTLSDLADNSVISEKLPALQAAIKAVASKHIRNIATIGGNICLDTRCWYYNQTKLWRDAREVCRKMGGSVCHAIKGSKRCHAINNSDTAPALIALNASITLVKNGNERQVPAGDFFNDDGAKYSVLEPGELLTSVTIPAPDKKSRSTFLKISIRKGIDFAIGSVAARVVKTGNKCSSATLVIGSMTSSPVSLEKAAQVILESGLTDESIEKAAETARSELGTVTNLFTSAGYKRDLAGILVKRALNELKKKK
jgi:4-hydroxybenzoyl-CoA reductase subunit beta